MDTTTIRQKLYEYIRQADDKKVKAIYTIVENDIDKVNEWWQDDKLMTEIGQRAADLKSGKDMGISWGNFKKGLPKENS
ncbi:addiction module protein [bacterium]|nr:addiction module protein [bacterium]